MKTYIREFEATEAQITILQTGNRTVSKVQNYRKDRTLQDISLCFSQPL